MGYSRTVPKNICDRFGERLRKVRHAKGLTQVELAEKAGIQSTYLSDMENAKKEPCLRVLEMLATSMGISVSKLLQGV